VLPSWAETLRLNRRSLAGEWDDMRKDQLERHLAALVCAGQLDVVEAQKEIAEDWVET
jgi:hypothetical protein